MSNSENAALLAHIVSQVESNVHFLVSQNHISQADANAFLAKLPNNNGNINATASPGLASRMRNMVVSSPATPAAPPKPAAMQQGRALWGYNENGQDADDLSFAAGDIIEIVEETNADWWMGKVNGKQALFPSSYVEKLKSPAAVAPAHASEKTPYRPFGAAYHGVNAPPPAGAGVNQVGLQEAPGQEEKKSKFGKYGNTMAHSAAGGVGFGLGAGLVGAIF